MASYSRNVMSYVEQFAKDHGVTVVKRESEVNTSQGKLAYELRMEEATREKTHRYKRAREQAMLNAQSRLMG